MLQVLCAGDVYTMDGDRYSLDYRLISGDVQLPQNALTTPRFSPHGRPTPGTDACTLRVHLVRIWCMSQISKQIEGVMYMYTVHAHVVIVFMAASYGLELW